MQHMLVQMRDSPAAQKADLIATYNLERVVHLSVQTVEQTNAIFTWNVSSILKNFVQYLAEKNPR